MLHLRTRCVFNVMARGAPCSRCGNCTRCSWERSNLGGVRVEVVAFSVPMSQMDATCWLCVSGVLRMVDVCFVWTVMDVSGGLLCRKVVVVLRGSRRVLRQHHDIVDIAQMM